MANTFTKIRKWAEEKGFVVEDKYGYGGKPCIHVYLGDRTGYAFDMRDSTIYMSIRGQRGNAGGLYMAQIKPNKHNDVGIDVGYGFQERSQSYCIDKMEYDLKVLKRNGSVV